MDQQSFEKELAVKAICRDILHERDSSNSQRMLLKRNPALQIGSFIVCLNVRERRLLLCRDQSALRSLMVDSLPLAPGHRWAYSLDPKFCYLSFTVTERCSLRCRYCFAGDVLYSKDMRPDLARKMAVQIPSISAPGNFPNVYFFGGEPTMNIPAIEAVMDTLDELGVDFLPKLLTNGIFNEQVLNFIAEQYMIVQFSYDGRADHLRTSDPTQTSLVLNNIKKCASQGLPIIIRPTISSLNVEHLTELLEEVYTLTGQSLVSINFGLINMNKGRGQTLPPTLAPDMQLFQDQFEKLLIRARELGVRISSIQMSTLRNDPSATVYMPCFVSTEGVMSLGAVYSGSHPESEGLAFGHFDEHQGAFVIDEQKIRILSQNYERNAFLHDQQACYAQSLCGGEKKAIKNARRVYEPSHLDFFCNDLECASMRVMTEVYLADLLRVILETENLDILCPIEGLYSVDIGPLISRY